MYKNYVMENTVSYNKHYLTIAFVILASIFLLFSLDKDTHTFSDLLKPGNLAALVVYYLPTFLICFLLFRYFIHKQKGSRSTLLSLTIGIPLSFVLVISALLLLKN